MKRGMIMSWVAALTVAALITTTTVADAKRVRLGFNCGNWMSQHFGLSKPISLALEWGQKFRQVSAQPGAVVVQHRRGRALGGGPGGHVTVIVSMQSQCRAMVQDQRGIYSRDICKNGARYVMPG